MVFTSMIQLVRNKGPDEFWRKRRIFRLTAHFVGRGRNCYSLAVRSAHRALAFATKDRALKKINMAGLWETRLHGACHEHHFTYPLLKESLNRLNVHLDRKSLADLSIWEPRTFKTMISLAWVKAAQEDLPGIGNLGPFPNNAYVDKED